MPLNFTKRQPNNRAENAIIGLPSEILLLLGGAGIGLSIQSLYDLSRGEEVSEFFIYLSSVGLVFLIYYWKKYKEEQIIKEQMELSRANKDQAMINALTDISTKLNQLGEIKSQLTQLNERLK